MSILNWLGIMELRSIMEEPYVQLNGSIPCSVFCVSFILLRSLLFMFLFAAGLHSCII
jgi:hypothetical protein